MEELDEAIIEKICEDTCRRKEFIILLIKICRDNNVKNIIKCVKKSVSNRTKNKSTLCKRKEITILNKRLKIPVSVVRFHFEPPL